MKLRGDYHSHTIYSSKPNPSRRHAKGTIRDNVEAAYRMGLEEIAISEHGPGHYLYGINKDYFKEVREEIDRLNQEYEPKGLKILLGVEANLISLDGDLDIDDEVLDYLDILLMGYHYGVLPKTFKDGLVLYGLNPISRLTGINRKRSKDLITRAYIRAIDKYPINIITHPGSKASLNIVELGHHAAKKDVALEISSKHSELSVENIRKTMDIEGLKYVLNSDAHSPEYIGKVEKGLKKAEEAGLPLDRIINLKTL